MRLPNGAVVSFTDIDFEERPQSQGNRAAQAGCSTLKRAAFTHAVLQEGRGTGWTGVLGSPVRQPGEHLGVLGVLQYGWRSAVMGSEVQWNIQHTVQYTASNPARFERLWR